MMRSRSGPEETDKDKSFTWDRKLDCKHHMAVITFSSGHYGMARTVELFGFGDYLSKGLGVGFDLMCIQRNYNPPGSVGNSDNVGCLLDHARKYTTEKVR